MINLRKYLTESLHPEIKSVISSNGSNKSKQSLMAAKIKDLSSRGENLGIENNMPKGSSRAFLLHKEPHKITLDGNPTEIKTGTKVAIKASLDRFHDKKKFDGQSLGEMQNHAEHGDSFINNYYRILSKHPHNNEYKSNKQSGIFPPLIEHDHNHKWSHVGQARDIKAGEFRSLTANKEHPKGIYHTDFTDSLIREHSRRNGKHWGSDSIRESHLDKVDTHPLVEKFKDYHNMTGHPPYDLDQIKNMGVFEHPDGSKHIVARDHGYSSDVEKAYTDAKKKQSSNS